MKIKVKNVARTQTNNNDKKVYRLKFQKNINPIENNFVVGNRVQHIDEKIVGTIKFIGNNEMSVLWDDNSRERFPLNTTKLAYVPDIQKRIDPLVDESVSVEHGETVQDRIMKNETVEKPTRNQLYQNVNDDLDDIYSQAFDNMNDTYDDIEDANPNNQQKQIDDIKAKATDEIIEAMKLKNMITNETEQAKRDEIAKMDDNQFENLKNEVISAKKRVEVERTEAELMLERIKNGGAIIGDFSSLNASTSSTPSASSFSGSSTRNLADIKTASRNNYNSDYVGELGEDGFSLDFGSDFNTPEPKQERKLNLENFQNLQGFTKPVQIQSEPKTYKDNINEAIANMDWTTLSKMF